MRQEQTRLGHIVSAKIREALSKVVQVWYRSGQHNRREIIADHVPRIADGFIAIMRLFGGNDFAPSSQSSTFNTNEEDEPRIDPAEAGFKRLVQRQAHRPQFDVFDRDLTRKRRRGSGHNFGSSLPGWAR